MVIRRKLSSTVKSRSMVSESDVKVFRSTLIHSFAKDGVYEGKTVTARVESYPTGLKLKVTVKFDDCDGNSVELTYLTNFEGSNLYIIKLFKDFGVDYLNATTISLMNLINRDVEIEVKNNGPYCNVKSLTPIKDQIFDAKFETALEIEDDLDFEDEL